MKMYFIAACMAIIIGAGPASAMAQEYEESTGIEASHYDDLSCAELTIEKRKKVYTNNCTESLTFLHEKKKKTGCKMAGYLKPGESLRFPVTHEVKAVCLTKTDDGRSFDIESLNQCRCIYR